MHNDLVELGWTETQWNRIVGTVSDEAQKARVAAQLLPMVGPEDATTVAVPSFALSTEASRSGGPPPKRLAVDSDPTLFLTTIAVNVALHTREAADPELSAALAMFRRAANYIARIEDAVVFNGRPPQGQLPYGIGGIPEVYDLRGNGATEGLFGPAAAGGRHNITITPAAGGVPLGDQVITAIIDAINVLDASGQLGPYACALSPVLFQAICTPHKSLVLPRDRILPFLQGPLLRSSAIRSVPPAGKEQNKPTAQGVVVALSGNPVELLVATDIHVRYLQTSDEPRVIFRVAERVALRIKEKAAIAMLNLTVP